MSLLWEHNQVHEVCMRNMTYTGAAMDNWRRFMVFLSWEASLYPQL